MIEEINNMYKKINNIYTKTSETCDNIFYLKSEFRLLVEKILEGNNLEPNENYVRLDKITEDLEKSPMNLWKNFIKKLKNWKLTKINEFGGLI